MLGGEKYGSVALCRNFPPKSPSMKQLAVVAGGYTGEREISLKSASMILEHIDRTRWAPTLVHIDHEGWRAETKAGTFPIQREDFSYVSDGTTHTFDAVFVIIHGTPGEDGKLQGYFDLIGMPYSTGPTTSMALTFSKAYCNHYLQNQGFKTAKNVLVRANDHYSTSEIVRILDLPVFVKPNGGGSSLATTKVDVKEGLHKAIEAALTVDREVIIEGFLPGTEVTCGVIEVEGIPTALPATEIVSEGEFFDYEAKYQGKSNEITPARISEAMMAEVQRQSVRIWELLDFRGMIRVDFMIEDEVPYLLEVNSVPGFSAASIIPQQAAAVGMDKTTLINHVLAELG